MLLSNGRRPSACVKLEEVLLVFLWRRLFRALVVVSTIGPRGRKCEVLNCELSVFQIATE